MFVLTIEPLGTKFQKQDDLEKTFLANGQGEPIEFGADQCTTFHLTVPFGNNFFRLGILVHNDTAKENLKQRLGNNLILSVLAPPRQQFSRPTPIGLYTRARALNSMM